MLHVQEHARSQSAEQRSRSPGQRRYSTHVRKGPISLADESVRAAPRDRVAVFDGEGLGAGQRS